MAWSPLYNSLRIAAIVPIGPCPMGALDLILLGQAEPGLSKVLLCKTLVRHFCGGRLWRVGMADAPFPQEVF